MQRTRKTRKPIPTHRAGDRVFCSYWGKWYTVEQVAPHPGWGVTVVSRWEDGHVSEHSTAYRAEDVIVRDGVVIQEGRGIRR